MPNLIKDENTAHWCGECLIVPIYVDIYDQEVFIFIQAQLPGGEP